MQQPTQPQLQKYVSSYPANFQFTIGHLLPILKRHDWHLQYHPIVMLSINNGTQPIAWFDFNTNCGYVDTENAFRALPDEAY